VYVHPQDGQCVCVCTSCMFCMDQSMICEVFFCRMARHCPSLSQRMSAQPSLLVVLIGNWCTSSPSLRYTLTRLLPPTVTRKRFIGSHLYSVRALWSCSCPSISKSTRKGPSKWLMAARFQLSCDAGCPGNLHFL
jgi:hypothetical protein